MESDNEQFEDASSNAATSAAPSITAASRFVMPTATPQQNVQQAPSLILSVSTVAQDHALIQNRPQDESSLTVANKPASNLKTNPFLKVPVTASQKVQKPPVKSQEEQRNNREKKVFATLTHIIVGYLVCWVPFHLVFDISSFGDQIVPDFAYKFAFWLTYFNSTLNPFLYNFSSPEFRKAFKAVVTRKRTRASKASLANHASPSPDFPSVFASIAFVLKEKSALQQLFDFAVVSP
ncbi:trace amine-associated receptor 4-like [Physella acuta]|uniref:trace amine-associated receptor 4-like n=1 Tax=Physella acuta TaxID=109671 RepID=UPI0027DDD2AD|nr:trace amine-associated receptor 4-like [Physella acuta]